MVCEVFDFLWVLEHLQKLNINYECMDYQSIKFVVLNLGVQGQVLTTWNWANTLLLQPTYQSYRGTGLLLVLEQN
jgi:hypothetical protein